MVHPPLPDTGVSPALFVGRSDTSHFLNSSGGKFLQGRILEVAALEHRNLLRLGRRFELGVAFLIVATRWGRRPLSTVSLRKFISFSIYVQVGLLAEDRLALLVDQLATLAPEVGQVVKVFFHLPPLKR